MEYPLEYIKLVQRKPGVVSRGIGTRVCEDTPVIKVLFTVAIVQLLAFPGLANSPPTLHCPSQSFEARVEGDSLRIAQVITVRCSEGCVDQLDITIPYGQDELRVNASDGSGELEVLTTLGTPLSRTISQNQSHTEVCITIPDPVFRDQDTVMILKYRVYDLPGDRGISRPIRSLLDGLLGREITVFEITYIPGVFDEGTEELFVSILSPLDAVTLEWEPEGDSRKLPDPRTGTVSIDWHLTGDIPERPVFKLVLRRGKVPGIPVPTVILVLLVLLIVIGVTLAYPYLRKRGRAD